MSLCGAFIKYPGNPAGGRDWKNPRVFQDVTEDVKTLLCWLRNLETSVARERAARGAG